MSVDIGEIGVHVAVRDPNEKPPAAPGGCGAPGQGVLSASQQDALVEQCVRQVLLALQQREAR